jgi:hypothetical protein
VSNRGGGGGGMVGGGMVVWGMVWCMVDGSSKGEIARIMRATVLLSVLPFPVKP